jgi:DNA-binding NtrC family response regulator
MATILIVDDETRLRLTMEAVLRHRGHQVVQAETCAAALKAIDRDVFDLALLDVRLPDGDGLELLRDLRQRSPELTALMLTAFGTVENAVEAMRLGADDFLQKPFGPERLVASVERALAHSRIQEELQRLNRQGPETAILGTSPAIEEVRRLIYQARDARAVVISGETGTGKDLVARAIHRTAAPASAPFVVVNCASFPESLIESELFGHVRGAFSGAAGARRGLLAQADGGTAFLDELGEVPLFLQQRLLRFLETGETRAVGADHPGQVNCRIVAATSRDLVEAMRQGGFREDFYYRLDVFRIYIPPLRERPQDIEPLAEHFLACIAHSLRRAPQRLGAAALEAAQRYHWPGNVRQLRHALERAILLSSAEELSWEHLLPSRAPVTLAERREPVAPAATPLPLAEVERRHILTILERVTGDRAEAAKLLGISRSTLRRKIIEYETTTVQRN